MVWNVARPKTMLILLLCHPQVRPLCSNTPHARARMADPNRGVVTEEEVRSVLANPTVSYVGIDGKQNVLGEVNGKHVRICFVEDKDRLLVITVINRGTRL